MHTFIRSLCVLIGLVVLAIEGGAYVTRVGLAATELATVAQDPTTQPLVQAADLSEEGCIRFPSWQSDAQSFNYGGTAIAFDQTRQSLWAVGHDHYDRIAEISLPTPGPCANVGALPRAAIRTPYIPTDWRTQVVGGAATDLGGVLPFPDGSKLVAAFGFYDANNDQITSHFRLSPTHQVSGPFRLDTAASSVAPNRAGSVSDWMIAVPAEWQALLGGDTLAGNCCKNIITRTSLGPALSVFTAAQVGPTPAPVTELLGYPSTQPTLGGCVTQGALFNCTARIRGAVWVAGTRSILFFQKIGTGPVSYSAGYSAPPYKTQVLAYDVNELVAVKRGQKRPWQVVPYATWDLPWKTTAIDNALIIQGAAYDPATRRIYLSISHQDGEMPLLRVWRVSGSTSPTTPPADTIAPSTVLYVTPTSATTGGIVSIAADALDNVGVTNVTFSVNGQVIKADQSLPYDASFTPTTPSNYLIEAQAWDAAGNKTTPPASFTLPVADPLPPPPPPDSDGDGVPDANDACPTVAGTQADGCPPPPPPAEVCGDGIDNDGDGQIDEDCAPPTQPPACSPALRITRVRGWPGTEASIRPWIEWNKAELPGASLASVTFDQPELRNGELVLTRALIWDTRGCTATVGR